MSSRQLLLHQIIACKSTLYLELHVQHENSLETLIHEMQLHTKQCVKNAWETKWGTLSVITVNNTFLPDSREILFSVSCRTAGIAFIQCQIIQLMPLKGACSVQDYCSLPKTQANRASSGWLLNLRWQVSYAHPEVQRPGQRKPLRRRKPLHGPWTQNQKLEKLTGKSSHLSWELVQACRHNLSLPQYRSHWVGEPAWQNSGTLEKKEATVPHCTFKPFQLTLVFLH